MHAEPAHPPPSEAPPTPPAADDARRRRRRRWRLFGFSLIGLAVLVVAAPHALNLGFVRRKVEAAIGESMGTEVRLGQLGFSWFAGISLGDLRIENPPDFGRERPMLTLRSLRGDVALLQLVRGRIDLSGSIDGLAVYFEQDAAGRSNLEALGGEGRSSGGAVEIEPDSDSTDLARLRLDFDLQDGLVEIRRNGELLESLRNLHCKLNKEFGSQILRMDLRTDLHRPDRPDHPGNLALRADVDAQTMVVDSQLTAAGLDLSRYRPLLAAFLAPGDVTALQGLVNGTVQARARGKGDDQEVFLEGSLTVETPRIAGALLQGMDVQAPRWTLSPNLQIQLGRSGSVPTVAAERFALDLGFATARGLTGAELQETLAGRTGLGLGYTLDLDALAGFGGPMPAMLKGAGGRVTGRLVLPITGGAMPDFARLHEIVLADAQVQARRIAVAGFELADLGSTVQLRDGGFRLQTTTGTLLNAGALTLDLSADLKDLKRLPFQFGVQWRGGKLRGESASLLRYAVPLLAGLQEGADLDGAIDLGLRLNGPALRLSGESWLQFFDTWSGDGMLALDGASVSPNQGLRDLLAAVSAGDRRLVMDRFGGAFTLAQGAVKSQLMEWEHKGRKYGLQGSTRLDGTMDWAIDLTAMLQQHKDGQKIVAALGGKPLRAGLGGTLDAPRFAMPDLAGLLQSGLQNAAGDLLKEKAGETLQKGLEGLLGGRKKN